jgi:hypothetical protein
MRNRRFSLLGIAVAMGLSITVLGAGPALAEPPSNDDFDAAIEVTALPFSHVAFTSEAVKASDDPDCSSGQRTVWYAFTPAEDMKITAHTIGSNYDTTPSVFTGARGALSQTCNDEHYFGYKQSLLSFEANTGQTYYFMVGSLAQGTRGTLKFFVDRAPGPPENDKSSKPTAINKLPFNVNQNVRMATTAEDDDDCAGTSNTVWYSFAAKKSQKLVVSTAGSDYDTTLIVYERGGGSLKRLACVDDSGSWTAKVTFEARADRTYLFRIGAGDGGATDLHFSLEAAPIPLKMSVTLARSAFVNTATGIARLHGTITCSREVSVVIDGSLRQRNNGRVTYGDWHKTIDCSKKASHWAANVGAGQRAFLQGSAGASMKATSQEKHATKKTRSRIVHLTGCECDWGF